MTKPYPIVDWDDAYANAAHIPGSDAFPERWATEAARFRSAQTATGRCRLDIAYGEGDRNRFDLFQPAAEPKGLVIFVHGGYWKAFDKSSWSHLAGGALAKGHAVAMPSYTLAPQARIGEIVREIAAAIEAVAHLVDGPIRLAGHSAGGHLVSRMIADPSPLPPDIRARIVNTVSISGLHDLRPLCATQMNETLRIDDAEARSESPALLRPEPGARLVAWCGADERPEFLRQNRLIGLMWDGFDIETSTQEEQGRHHFDVIDGLANPDHPLTAALLRLP
ncbi:alpha/beta hydrolase [Pararhizobium haloflavum]|uniref:alpha/beta hydrolase n=1 Tax=Pararhizobium haloflavum TaxID=2037914 RepID=UPI000C1A84E8|nr:alpha/beta hydrolase [Pararhizobium haloflavum]